MSEQQRNGPSISMWSIKLIHHKIKDEIVCYKAQECERRGETNMDKLNLTKHPQHERPQYHYETEEYTNE
jgi:hypothetical protein